jgi:hypothetical protein
MTILVNRLSYVSVCCLMALSSAAQTDNTCTVLRWETQTYSQSAHITRNHLVYSVQIGNTVYQIARRSTEVEMNSGQQIQCRVDGGHMLVVNGKGKETKYDIVGSEPPSK